MLRAVVPLLASIAVAASNMSCGMCTLVAVSEGLHLTIEGAGAPLADGRYTVVVRADDQELTAELDVTGGAMQCIS